MKKSKFLENISLIINDDDLIINEAKNDDTIQKLYFKNSTTLHQTDNIVKQGLLKKINNVFSKNTEVIKKTLEKFMQKYKMVPPKKNGKTLVGSFAKYQGDYIILLKSDLKALKTGENNKDFTGLPITLSVLEGDNPDMAVDGLENIQYTIDKGTTEDEIADFINKNIKTTLGISLTTNSNPPPKKQDK